MGHLASQWVSQSVGHITFLPFFAFFWKLFLYVCHRNGQQQKKKELNMHNCEIITNTLANDQIHTETATEEQKKSTCVSWTTEKALKTYVNFDWGTFLEGTLQTICEYSSMPSIHLTKTLIFRNNTMIFLKTLMMMIIFIIIVVAVILSYIIFTFFCTPKRGDRQTDRQTNELTNTNTHSSHPILVHKTNTHVYCCCLAL